VICLTFDTDYMSAVDMQRFLKDYLFPGQGTFFLWKALDGVDWEGHEIEPHPYLSQTKAWSVELSDLVESLAIKPKGIRTHSCTYSQTFGVHLKNSGYEYMSIATPLLQQNLFPYRHPWGVWELPIYYMDNMDFCMSRNWTNLEYAPFDRNIIKKALSGEGLYVFDFHPLHIILNTRSFDDYESVKRGIISGEKSPFDYQDFFQGRGTRTFFQELCMEMHSLGVSSVTCLDAIKN
jgi:hypothetical protein